MDGIGDIPAALEQVMNLILGIGLSAIPNPFGADDCDFENFAPVNYNIQISKDILAKTNMSVPLNIFKFILIKINPINYCFEQDPTSVKKLMKSIKEVKAKYAEFEREGVTMSARERKYVRSAVASLELAEMSIAAFEKGKEYQKNKLANPNKKLEFKDEVVKVQKLKEVCNDILKGDNPLGEGTIVFLNYILGAIQIKRSYEVIRFILCVMDECYKSTYKSRKDSGLIEKSKGMKQNLIDMKMTIAFMKLSFLGTIFDVSSTLRELGKARYFESPKNDEEDGKTLMELFLNQQDVDDLCRIPIKIKTFEEAKLTYELMLKLIKVIEPGKDNTSGDYDLDYFKGIAQAFYAAYLTKPEDIYRFSESSLKLLESARLKYNGIIPKNKELLMASIDLNYKRMWNIKYDQYQKEKTQENLIELREIAAKKMKWITIFTQKIGEVASTFHTWLQFLDVAKCLLLVYKDPSCARKAVLSVHSELIKAPEQILVFNNNFKTAKFTRNLSKEAFVEAFFKEFDANIETKEKHPFEDGSGFADFVCYPYIETTENFWAKATLETPLNIYKFLVIKSLIAYNNESNLSKNQQMKKLEKIKKTYKDFMHKEISMTVEESKLLSSAYGTLKLGEIYYKYFAGTEKFTKMDFDKFDFGKLKNICSSILDGYAQEVPLLYLATMFSKFWYYHHEIYEILRFLLCVMNEVMRKARAIREENGTLLKSCICVQITIDDAEMYVNHNNLLFLESVFLLSNFHFTTNSAREEKPTKENEIGKMLMGLFENYEGDEELQEVPKKAENYDQAKMMFELILKLTNKRKSTGEVQHIFDSNYFEGLAYGYFAAFVPDSSEVYKLCEKSMKFLEGVWEHVNTNNEFEKLVKTDHIMGVINENFSRMWKIKFDIYKKNKNEENKKALDGIVAERINWGKNFLESFTFPNWPFAKWWTRLDLIKCHLLVKKDEKAAEKIAEALHKELMEESSYIRLFNTIAGTEFDRKMGRKDFVKLIIQKFGKQQ